MHMRDLAVRVTILKAIVVYIMCSQPGKYIHHAILKPIIIHHLYHKI